ncbi:MAG: ABC transporter ATP-binding protein [Oscillospiraceae bacterium]|nr:ABC transporter ATP-binding protein [Oscillospiraceae bacterium]
MSRINIRDLSVEYGTKNKSFKAVDRINLDIKEGEFVSLLGASGCGKSTLISTIDGLRRPSGGTVFIDGEPISGTGKDRSIVFQNYSLFPWMTVKKNVEFGLRQLRPELSKKERNDIALEFVEKVGLSEFKNKYPLQLSGGQQQRVAIARALAVNTPILLMDEPFGALDAKTRASLQDLLLSLWRSEEKKKTVIFVTHDVDEAIFLSDRIVIMQPNPGRIYKEVSVPFSRPRIRENITDTEEYKIFRNEIINAFYEAEKEVAYHDTEKKISAGNSSVVRSFNSGTVSAVAGGR